MNTKDILQQSRSRVIAILIVSIIFVVFKVFCFPTYEAESIIMIDIKNRATSVSSEKMDLRDNLGYIRIHEELLRSDPILRKVVEDLKLYQEPGLPLFHSENATPTEREKEKLVRKAVELLQKKYIATSSPPFTNLISVRVKYKNADKAALIANHLIATYRAWSVGFSHDEVDNVITYLKQEVSKIKDQMERSEDALRKFKEENNVADLPEEVKAYLQIIPERFKAQSALDLEKEKSLLQLMQSTSSKQLELQVELMRLRELYTDESLQVKFMKRNVEEFQNKLRAISVRVKWQDLASKKHIGMTGRNLSAYKTEHLLNDKGLPEKQMKSARLAREVKINETAYAMLVDELEKAELVKAKQTTENIKIVSSARVPLKPKGRMIALLTGVVMSCVLALGMPLLWHYRRILIG